LNDTAGDIRARQLLHDLLSRPLRSPLTDNLIDFINSFHSDGIGGKQRIIDQILPPNNPTKRLPFDLVGYQQQDIAILCGVAIVGRKDPPGHGIAPSPSNAIDEVTGKLRNQGTDSGIIE
jgi:hypothetical protein